VALLELGLAAVVGVAADLVERSAGLATSCSRFSCISLRVISYSVGMKKPADGGRGRALEAARRLRLVARKLDAALDLRLARAAGGDAAAAPVLLCWRRSFRAPLERAKADLGVGYRREGRVR
jgi:hypothetical protein